MRISRDGIRPTRASSLGSVLLHQAIRMAPPSGVQTFDFLRGDEPYRYRFGAVDSFDHSYLLARGLSGRALELELAVRHRVQAIQAVESERANRSQSRCASVNRSKSCSRPARDRRRHIDARASRSSSSRSIAWQARRSRSVRRASRVEGHELRYSGETCGDDRHAGGHCFHERDGNPLHPAGRIADGGEHEHVGAAEFRSDHIGRTGTAELYARASDRETWQAAHFGPRRTIADQHETKLGVSRSERRRPPPADSDAPSSVRARPTQRSSAVAWSRTCGWKRSTSTPQCTT